VDAELVEALSDGWTDALNPGEVVSRAFTDFVLCMNILSSHSGLLE
jgi:hypothetical protein